MARGIAVAALAAALFSCSSTPPPADRRDWWLGLDKLTANEGRKAARDFALHAAAGAATATAGRYATGRCGPGFAVAFSLGPGAVRELYQVARAGDHPPHLLDRAVDLLGWITGGMGAWALYHEFGC